MPRLPSLHTDESAMRAYCGPGVALGTRIMKINNIIIVVKMFVVQSNNINANSYLQS